jgi:hypothetical protein
MALRVRVRAAVVDSDMGGDQPVDDDTQTKFVSKLTFVDLAGSERLKRTQATPWMPSCASVVGSPWAFIVLRGV